MGQSGSGKSSCVSLLQRLYDCQVPSNWGRAGGGGGGLLGFRVLGFRVQGSGFRVGRGGGGQEVTVASL